MDDNLRPSHRVMTCEPVLSASRGDALACLGNHAWTKWLCSIARESPHACMCLDSSTLPPCLGSAVAVLTYRQQVVLGQQASVPLFSGEGHGPAELTMHRPREPQGHYGISF